MEDNRALEMAPEQEAISLCVCTLKIIAFVQIHDGARLCQHDSRVASWTGPVLGGYLWWLDARHPV